MDEAITMKEIQDHRKENPQGCGVNECDVCRDLNAHKRHDDQMDCLTRVLYEMCGETADLRALARVTADALTGVFLARRAGISADECVRIGRAASAEEWAAKTKPV